MAKRTTAQKRPCRYCENYDRPAGGMCLAVPGRHCHPTQDTCDRWQMAGAQKFAAAAFEEATAGNPLNICSVFSEQQIRDMAGELDRMLKECEQERVLRICSALRVPACLLNPRSAPPCE